MRGEDGQAAGVQVDLDHRVGTQGVDPVVEAARWEQKAWLHVREKESFRHVSEKRSSSIRLRRARCSIRVGIAGGDDISLPHCASLTVCRASPTKKGHELTFEARHSQSLPTRSAPSRSGKIYHTIHQTTNRIPHNIYLSREWPGQGRGPVVRTEYDSKFE